MPTVPSYQSQVQTERYSNGTLNVDAPIEAFGGGSVVSQRQNAIGNLANAVQGVARDVNRISETVMRERAQADKTRVEDSVSKAVRLKTKYTYGGGDPENFEPGFVSRKGESAFGVADEYLPRFEKDLSDIENGLASDEQKRAFRAQANNLVESFNEQISKHTYME